MDGVFACSLYPEPCGEYSWGVLENPLGATPLFNETLKVYMMKAPLVFKTRFFWEPVPQVGVLKVGVLNAQSWELNFLPIS